MEYVALYFVFNLLMAFLFAVDDDGKYKLESFVTCLLIGTLLFVYAVILVIRNKGKDKR